MRFFLSAAAHLIAQNNVIAFFAYSVILLGKKQRRGVLPKKQHIAQHIASVSLICLFICW